MWGTVFVRPLSVCVRARRDQTQRVCKLIMRKSGVVDRELAAPMAATSNIIAAHNRLH